MTKNDKKLFNPAVRGPFAYVCGVRDTGYEWSTILRPVSMSKLKEAADALETTWLVVDVPNEEPNVHLYQPLLESDLHRQFGRLSPTRNNIKRFANRCGLLGNPVALYDPEKQGKPQPLFSGESFRFWEQEIKKISSLLDLWEHIQHQKLVDGLHVQWNYQPTRVNLEWRFSGGHVFYSIANENIPSEKELVNILYQEQNKSARLFFLLELQNQLKGRVNPRFDLFNTEQILMVPDSLISAIYASFALEVCGQFETKVKCRGCDIFFPPDKNKKYHDEKCKKRDWYRRHRGKEALDAIDD